MRPLPRTLWMALPLAVLLGCGGDEAADEPTVAAEEVAADAPRIDPAAVRSEIEAVNRQFADALNRGDAAGAAQVYTEDARILPPDMPVTEGRQNIEQFWAGGAQQLGIRDVQLTTDELEVLGEDAAYEQGRYQFNTNQGPAQGKYIVIWRRTPEGWRWHRDIWNPSPAGGGATG